MALTDENGGLVMPVSPMTGNSNGGFGDGNGWWIILLFILLCGGFNNGYGGNGGGTSNLYPWMNQAELTSGGFRDQMMNSSIGALQSSVNGISNQLCNGFASVSNGFSQAEVSDNARQIANMQQSFATQTAITSGLTNLQSQLAQCCCDNRLATCQTQNIIQNESNATRFADANNTRDIIESTNRNGQLILDKLCQLELDGKNDRIADLERQLTMANLSASQTAQTARLLADNTAQTTALEQYLNPTPIPAYVVQNPNCCTNTCGCGSF